MSFEIVFTLEADAIYEELENQANKASSSRASKSKTKSSKQEGLFKQVQKTIALLQSNPKHPSLKTHKYESIINPYNRNEPIFEAYVQNNTPGAYRVFWCYGPDKKQITIITITEHP